MSNTLSTYLCDHLSDTRKVTQEVLVTALFTVHKWKTGNADGAPDQIKDALEAEKFDDKVMDLIQQYLISFAKLSGSGNLFQLCLDVLGEYADPRIQMQLTEWLQARVQSMITANREAYQLTRLIESMGELVFDDPQREVTDINLNVNDWRRYLRDKTGSRLPW